MTREELKRHCVKQIEDCEMWAKIKGVEPHEKIYEEHKLILELLEQEPCKNAIGREDMLDAIGHGTTYTSEELQRIIKGLPPVNPQKCDRCEVGNPCLYCKHEFEPQEREG